MALTPLDICNLAIDKISGDRIESLGEESPLGVFCADNYPHKRGVILGSYRWTFANRVALLSPVAPEPGEPQVMANKYARPADMIGAPHAFRDAPNPRDAERTPYVIDVDGHFWADEGRVFVEYTGETDEARWPVWFRELVIVAFAADLAAHAQNRSLQRDYEAKAWGTPQENGQGGLYEKARNEDARLAPPRQLVSGVDPGPLVGVRALGAWRGHPFRYGFTQD